MAVWSAAIRTRRRVTRLSFTPDWYGSSSTAIGQQVLQVRYWARGPQSDKPRFDDVFRASGEINTRQRAYPQAAVS